MIIWLWLEPGKTDEVPFTIVEWLNGGTRAMIETAEGARVNVPKSQLREAHE